MFLFALFAISIMGVNVSAFKPYYSRRSMHNKIVVHAIRMASEGWFDVSILQNTKSAEGIRFMEIAVPDNVKEAYKIPGQYVQIRKGGGKPGFYAMCSPPTSPTTSFEFIVKESENNAFLSGSNIGEKVEMSLPQGKGYQIKEFFEKYKFDFPTTNVILMACGTGLAPIAAAIESKELGIGTSSYNSLFQRKGTLYIGARTPEHLPLKEKYESWKQMGLNVIPVISKPTDSWTGQTGYIQDVLKKDTVKVPRNSGALLCGHRGMVDNVKEIMLEAGVFEGRILLNF